MTQHVVCLGSYVLYSRHNDGFSMHCVDYVCSTCVLWYKLCVSDIVIWSIVPLEKTVFTGYIVTRQLIMFQLKIYNSHFLSFEVFTVFLVLDLLRSVLLCSEWAMSISHSVLCPGNKEEVLSSSSLSSGQFGKAYLWAKYMLYIIFKNYKTVKCVYFIQFLEVFIFSTQIGNFA